jgi:hypothetical protein
MRRTKKTKHSRNDDDLATMATKFDGDGISDSKDYILPHRG